MTKPVGRLAGKFHHRRMRRLEGLREDDACLPAERPPDLARHADARDELNHNEIGLDKAEGSLELQPILRVVGDLGALKATAAVNQDLDSCRRSLDAATT